MHGNSFKPLITTVIPTYRRPEFVRQAIQSVLNQTYANFLVCVYDNASGDDTAKVVSEMVKKDSRIRYYCHPKNIGAIANFNFGMQQVKTPFFSLLGDDNTLLPNFFEEAIGTLNSNQEAIFFAGQAIKINQKGQELGGSVDSWKSGLIYPPEGLLYIFEKGIPNWEGVLFRSTVMNCVGLLEQSFGGGADQDFMMRIARKNVFFISKKPCAYFLYHNESWSTNRSLDDYLTIEKALIRPWLMDENLNERVKIKIKNASDKRVKRFLSAYFCRACFADTSKNDIENTIDLLENETDWSLKLYIAMGVAKLANYNQSMKKIVSSLVLLYLHIRVHCKKLFRRLIFHLEL